MTQCSEHFGNVQLAPSTHHAPPVSRRPVCAFECAGVTPGVCPSALARCTMHVVVRPSDPAASGRGPSWAWSWAHAAGPVRRSCNRACSCFNLGNTCCCSRTGRCAHRHDIDDRGPLYTVGYSCMYAHLLCCTSDIYFGTSLGDNFGSRHALLGDLVPANPWSRMDSAATFSHCTLSGFSSTVCIARHTQTFWVVVLAPRALGRSAPSRSVDSSRSRPRPISSVHSPVGFS